MTKTDIWSHWFFSFFCIKLCILEMYFITHTSLPTYCLILLMYFKILEKALCYSSNLYSFFGTTQAETQSHIFISFSIISRLPTKSFSDWGDSISMPSTPTVVLSLSRQGLSHQTVEHQLYLLMLTAKASLQAIPCSLPLHTEIYRHNLYSISCWRTISILAFFTMDALPSSWSASVACLITHRRNQVTAPL